MKASVVVPKNIVLALALALAQLPAPAIQGFCPRVPKTDKFRDMICKYASVLERTPYSNSMQGAARELKAWVEERDARVEPLDISYISFQYAVTPAPIVPARVESEYAMALEADPADVRVGPTPKKPVQYSPSAKFVYTMARSLNEHHGQPWEEAIKIADDMWKKTQKTRRGKKYKHAVYEHDDVVDDPDTHTLSVVPHSELR